MTDKKALRILKKTLFNPLSEEEKAYCIEHGVLSEHNPVPHDALIEQIKALSEKIDIDDAAKAFLYSISSKDYRYRTVLSSLIWAKALPRHECEKTEHYGEYSCAVCGMEMSKDSDMTELNMQAHCRARLCPEKTNTDINCAGYVYNDLTEFMKIPKVSFCAEDVKILNRIFGLVREISPTNKVNALLKLISAEKSLPVTASDAYSVLGVLSACGAFDTPEYKGTASGFTRCDERGFVSETDIYFPLNFWHGKNGTNYDALKKYFGRVTDKLSENDEIRGKAEYVTAEKKPTKSKAEQYFTDGEHFVDLDDRKRYYYGLSPINPAWDKLTMYSVTHLIFKRSEIFFEGDTVKKLIYEEISCGGKEYMESDMDVPTNNRITILPKTRNGREQRLTPSLLQTYSYMQAHIYVQFKEKASGVLVFNAKNYQQILLPNRHIDTKADFDAYTEEYIKSCPPDYKKQLDSFINKPHTTVAYFAGDIFRVRVSPTLYTYGLILGVVRRLEKWDELPEFHPMRFLMTQPLIIRQYGIMTSNPYMSAEELAECPLLETQFAQDNEILWETYPIVCHKKLTESDIELGFKIDEQKHIVWGFSLYNIDTDDDKWREISQKRMDYLTDFCVNMVIHINQFNLTEGIYPYIDKYTEDKATIVRLLGLDADNPYDSFAEKCGGLTRKQYIELIEKRERKINKAPAACIKGEENDR